MGSLSFHGRMTPVCDLPTLPMPRPLPARARAGRGPVGLRCSLPSIQQATDPGTRCAHLELYLWELAHHPAVFYPGAPFSNLQCRRCSGAEATTCGLCPHCLCIEPYSPPTLPLSTSTQVEHLLNKNSIQRVIRERGGSSECPGMGKMNSFQIPTQTPSCAHYFLCDQGGVNLDLDISLMSEKGNVLCLYTQRSCGKYMERYIKRV